MFNMKDFIPNKALKSQNIGDNSDKPKPDFKTSSNVSDQKQLDNASIITTTTLYSINFNQIATSIKKKYSKDYILCPTTKQLITKKTLIIFLEYFYSTDLNPFKEDIMFSISITENFPVIPPRVRCLTDFTFPTLYDNRELLESVLKHNWSSKKYPDPLVTVEEIITQIPLFLKRCYENISNRTLVYYGKYVLNFVYDINDFIQNSTLKFYHCVYYKTKKEKSEKYLIITDLNFLLFSPYVNKENNLERNKGVLFFYTPIEKIVSFDKKVPHKRKGGEAIVFECEGISLELLLKNKELNTEVVNAIEKRKKFLNSRFCIFQYESYFGGEGEFSGHKNAEFNDEKKKEKENKNEKEIKELIKFKENIYNSGTKKRSENLVKELTELYEKIIEIISAKEEDFSEYLAKMKGLIDEESKEGGNLNREINGEELFKNSKAYNNQEESK